jgi:hypothetical protein
MTLHWPQIVLLVIIVLADGMALALHGKPKTGDHNFWSSILSTAIMLTLLYYGGFFS